MFLMQDPAAATGTPLETLSVLESQLTIPLIPSHASELLSMLTAANSSATSNGGSPNPEGFGEDRVTQAALVVLVSAITRSAGAQACRGPEEAKRLATWACR